MAGIQLANMVYPNRHLFSAWGYLGLIYFGGLTYYDRKSLNEGARTKQEWDPIKESLDLFIDVGNFLLVLSFLWV